MIDKQELELLAPVGGREQLEGAIHFGADAVYLAGQRWGMRARADNFNNEELAQAVVYAHTHQVKAYLTLNTLMFEDDVRDMPRYLQFVDSIGMDAIVVGDLGALALVRTHAPHADIHISTQASVANSAAAREYVRLGAKRIVLAREMTLEHIAALHKALGDAVELEAFVHGAMCMAVSGRCLLSSAMVGLDRSASCGECTQPCRWTWSLVEESRPNLHFDLDEDERGSYILSANDLCMIEHIDALVQAGIRNFKIEGRNKGVYYVAATTNAYRHVLDGAEPAVWLKELEATSHRPYSTGFYFKHPTQNPGKLEYSQDRILVAMVQTCEASHEGSGYLTEVLCRNKAHLGDELIALRPYEDVVRFVLTDCERYLPLDEMWISEPVLSHNMELYRFHTPFPLSAGDIICRPD